MINIFLNNIGLFFVEYWKLRLICASGLFKMNWVLVNNLDAARAGQDSAVHYLHPSAFIAKSRDVLAPIEGLNLYSFGGGLEYCQT